MAKKIRQIIGFISILVGIGYMVTMLYLAMTDRLTVEFLGEPISADIPLIFALLLKLPLPFHMISVGFTIQRRWLPPTWSKTIRWATIISGCLLGASLIFRYLLLN
jgi:uncharacterized BrkB/YihY/UPF0761 family membrane protein